MVYKTEKELQKDISAGRLFPVYLLYGEENFLKSFYLDKLIRTVFPDGQDGFDLLRLDGKKISLQELSDAVGMIPLTSQKRCVVADDFDAAQFSESGIKDFASVMQELSSDVILIFVTRSADPNSKDAKTKKILSAIEKSGALAEFKKRTENDLIAFIASRLESAGCSITNSGARLLIERCSDDLQVLAGEADKLIAYQQKGIVSEETILKVSCAVVEADIYALSKFLLKSDMDAVMNTLDSLFYLRRPASVILSTLSYSFIDLYRAGAGRRAGKTAAEIAADFSYRYEFRVTNAMRDSRSLELSRLGSAIDILARAELDLKSSRVEERVLVEAAVTAIDLALKGEQVPC